MNICILGGFLGSGKTTLLMQLARYITENTPGEKDCKVAIIENEIGRVSIDDRLLGSRGLEVQTLFSGCVCCTLAVSLIDALKELRERMDPEWVIVETTGAAIPVSIRNNLEAWLGESAGICVVADAQRWPRLMLAMEPLIRSQLDGADAVLVNKTDLAPEEQIAAMEADLAEICPDALRVRVSGAGEVDGGIWNRVMEALK